ncbi:uncharacterized protein PAC_02452 [Phialocephala subalpina]|uniref:Uncharacterized protein n=1 Tax=Phialocephala subalpina TaxID=576137 RepID=A0A1L7WII9_9HELO|nr:uncharacterized protein PAC_02452 [Phialocephala subalpina]
MLFGKPERSARFLVPLFIIFISTAFVVYEWGAFLSQPIRHILPLDTENYFSIPTSSGDHGTVDKEVDPKEYRQIYSVSTADRKYFFIDFVDKRSINPNIIPHPFLEDTWVLVAQRHDPEEFSQHPMSFAELSCNAIFQNGTLRCLESPSILPIETKSYVKCEGDLVVLNMNQGPHDARMFYGPEAPHIIYGSNSEFTCFGQWMQDLGPLIDWRNGTFAFPDTDLKNVTEIQRPPPYGALEKNFFLFWDKGGQAYVHYDVSPTRSFAKLELDGSVGEDLAPLAGDETCMAKYMPPIKTGNDSKESIHQATNSLSVTLCKRSDPSCQPNDSNTFIFTIFQHKRYHMFHSVYEPFAMLFEKKSPFKIHGISEKPFWIHGRWKPSDVEEPEMMKERIENGKIRNYNQTEMMYITSMSWKSSGQKYHGYIDDVVFLAFGIEDFQSAGIDVVVGDLLLDIGLC